MKTVHDHLKTLGLGRNASVNEIKRTYRSLAHRHHPDKAGGSESRFREIHEAYTMLLRHHQQPRRTRRANQTTPPRPRAKHHYEYRTDIRQPQRPSRRVRFGIRFGLRAVSVGVILIALTITGLAAQQSVHVSLAKFKQSLTPYQNLPWEENWR